MKKLTFSLIAVFMSLLISAQIDQGSIMLSGSLGFSSQNPTIETKTGSVTKTVDGIQSSSFEFGFYGGFFFMDNMSAGLNVGIGNSKSVYKSTFGNIETIDTDKSSSFTIAPSLRYYFELDPKLFVFGELIAGFGSARSIDELKVGTVTTTEETNYSLMGFGIIPGFYYMMSQKVGLEMKFGFLGYESLKTKSKPSPNTDKTVTDNGFGLNLDLNTLNIGIVVKL